MYLLDVDNQTGFFSSRFDPKRPKLMIKNCLEETEDINNLLGRTSVKPRQNCFLIRQRKFNHHT